MAVGTDGYDVFKRFGDGLVDVAVIIGVDRLLVMDLDA